MDHDSILSKAVINFLHYHTGKSVEEATVLYGTNKTAFSIVADVLGTDFIIGLLEGVVIKQTKKKKGNKNG